jgi:uncharacterized membrane-anchored protein
MNKKRLFFIIGIFWIVLLGVVIVSKEFTLKTGDEILLKTIPIDPRDLFRGDYVVLKYEITNIDENIYSLSSADFNVGDKIHVILNKGQKNIASISGISKVPPKNGLYIKGTVKSRYARQLIVEYGIESYFVPEGKGEELERNRQGLYVKVKIDKFGNAIITELVRKEI